MKKNINLNERIELLRYNKNLLIRWIKKGQSGNSIGTFLKENHLFKIVLFYWNEISDLLYYEFKDTEIQIVGVIDERKDLNIPVCLFAKENEIPQDIDLIIICTALDVCRIEESLRKKTECLILTMDDLL